MNRTLIGASVAIASLLVLAVAFASRKSAMGKDGVRPSGAASSRSGEAGRIPVLVELFTSEGCSSCPPADALLAKYAKNAPAEGVEIIPLAEHVDYWNHLGWADPFSSAQFSNRQRDYATSLRLDSVYTPQMIVDGRKEFVGSDDGTAENAINDAAQRPKVAVQITPDAREGKTLPLRIHVGSWTAAQDGEAVDVTLAITEDNLKSNVTRGENAGRNLAHVGVVRRWSVLGQVKPREPFALVSNVALEPGWKTENLHAVVFIQGRRSRQVYGAATIRLNAAVTKAP